MAGVEVEIIVAQNPVAKQWIISKMGLVKVKAFRPRAIEQMFYLVGKLVLGFQIPFADI